MENWDRHEEWGGIRDEVKKCGNQGLVANVARLRDKDMDPEIGTGRGWKADRAKVGVEKRR